MSYYPNYGKTFDSKLIESDTSSNSGGDDEGGGGVGGNNNSGNLGKGQLNFIGWLLSRIYILLVF